MAELDSELSKGGLVVVDFTATWCGPCQRISPEYEALATKYESVTFLKVDVDDASDVAEKYDIQGMPTFLFFVGGERKHQVVGANIAEVEKAVLKFK